MERSKRRVAATLALLVLMLAGASVPAAAQESKGELEKKIDALEHRFDQLARFAEYA